MCFSNFYKDRLVHFITKSTTKVYLIKIELFPSRRSQLKMWNHVTKEAVLIYLFSHENNDYLSEDLQTDLIQANNFFTGLGGDFSHINYIRSYWNGFWGDVQLGSILRTSQKRSVGCCSLMARRWERIGVGGKK